MSSPAIRTSVAVGGAVVTYLPDGYALLNPAVVFAPGTNVDWASHSEDLDAYGRVLISMGSFLIESEGKRILVDLANGDIAFEIPDVVKGRGGQLLDSLAAAGLRPEDVDIVVFSHLHPDHVGWTSTGGELTFPNARHLVSDLEWAFWTGAEGGGPNAPDAQTVIEPLKQKVELISDGAVIAPGVTVQATPGHTPGHLSVVVTDPAGVLPGRVLILSDVVHWAGQLVECDVVFGADADAAQARATRDTILGESADRDTIIAAGHFSDQVFGKIRTTDSGLSWVTLAGSSVGADRVSGR